MVVAHHLHCPCGCIDLLLLQQSPRIDRDANGVPQRVWLSAVTGEGTDLLLQAITELVGDDLVNEELALGPNQGQLRAALYRLGAVAAEEYSDDGVAHVSVRMPRSDWNRLMAQDEQTAQ